MKLRLALHITITNKVEIIQTALQSICVLFYINHETIMIFEIHKKFIEFLKELLQSLNYEVQITHGSGDEGIDLIIQRENIQVFADVKVNRTRNRPPLINALLQLRFVVLDKDAQNGILIITSIVEPAIIESLSKKYGIIIWDRSILFELTKKNDDLRKQFEYILSELKQSGEEDIYDGIFEVNNFSIERIWTKIYQKNLTVSPITKGDTLYKELKAISSGRTDASLFEKKCEEILKYLFDIDLSGWNPQNTTDDTLHRFDLIARIISQNDFWRFIARDFRTRYIIFEFKNYTDPITQSEIYTTEKYLYTTALRTFAIIIARNGADKNAGTAMKGSLREHGKLIICLDLEDVSKMLHMKDNGDDPNNLLSEKIDNLLMQLSR